MDVRRVRPAPLVVLMALLMAVLTGCSDSTPDTDAPLDPPAAAGPSPSLTLTPIPLPPRGPPTGRLLADVQQSSLDSAIGHFQVWVHNDTDTAITPLRVVYRDDRFRHRLYGGRLREIPSQFRRGFPFDEPARPVCASTATSGSGTVRVVYRLGGVITAMSVPVEDEADVIARGAAATCLTRKVGQVADLRWADAVPASGAGGQGSTGTLTLQIDPTGRSGHTLVIDSITGNPVFSPADGGVFGAQITVTGDQPARRIAVPIKPTRCDAHAFGESGSANAFAFNVHLDGQPGQFVLRLGVEGARNAFDFGLASCGGLTGL